MANVVEIVIRVDNAQGVQALNATKAAVKNLGAEGEVSFRQFSTGTDVATAGLGRAGAGMRTMGGHATTSLDAVRLLSQEFGLRLPRALEAMLSRMPAVTSALTNFIGLAAGVAVAEVVVRTGKAVYDLEQKYFSLSAAAKEYRDEVEKRRDEDFINPRSIEDATDRIRQATAEAEKFSAVSQKLNNVGGWNVSLVEGLAAAYDSHTAAESANKKKEQRDSLIPQEMARRNEIKNLEIELDHALDGHLQGQKKITAERSKTTALAAEELRYMREVQRAQNPFANRNSGEEKFQLQNQIAEGHAAAQTLALQREVTEKTIAMQDEARNAGLRGNALYLAQRQEAEATIRRSATGTQAEIDAVHRRFFNEEKARALELMDLAKKSADAARRVGLEGVPAIAAELRSKLDEIQELQDKTSGGAPLTRDQDNALASMRNSANQESFAKRRKLDSDYTDYVDEQVARRTDTEIGAFAKVAAAQARERAEAERRYSKNYINAAGDDIGSKENHADRARELLSIDADAAAQRRKLEEDLNQRTLQMDTEADQAERRIRGSGLNAWVENYRSSVTAIEAARQQLRTRIDREENQPGVTGAAHDSFERQKIDADRKANAEIVELNQQMRQQLSNNLQSAFDDPVHYIQNRMKQMFFQMLADWLLQTEAFKGTFGRMMGGLQLGGGTTHSAGVGSAIGQISGSGISSAGLPGVVGAPSGTSGTGGGFAGYSGTVNQALAAPGSGTAAMTPFGALSDVSSLAGTGTAAISALSSSDSESAHATGLGDAGSSDSVMNPPAGASSGISAMGLVGAGFGAYTGTKGIISAFESGKASGILSGGASGAAMGASIGMLGGPLGAAIGAGVGALGGATAGLVGWASGEGNRLGAAKYYKSSILPQMEAALTSYVKGSGDSNTAMSSINAIAAGGFSTLSTQYGASAAQWAKAAYIDKERTALERQVESMAKGGRDYTSMSAAQFHSGGRIAGFGDLGTSASEGFIHAMLGETVVNPVASSAHSPYLSAMNSGASEAEMAAMYLRASGSSGSMALRGGGGDTHHSWNVSAMDTDSFRKMLRGGGARAIEQEANKYVTQYAGDAANG